MVFMTVSHDSGRFPVTAKALSTVTGESPLFFMTVIRECGESLLFFMTVIYGCGESPLSFMTVIYECGIHPSVFMTIPRGDGDPRVTDNAALRPYSWRSAANGSIRAARRAGR